MCDDDGPPRNFVSPILYFLYSLSLCLSRSSAFFTFSRPFRPSLLTVALFLLLSYFWSTYHNSQLCGRSEALLCCYRLRSCIIIHSSSIPTHFYPNTGTNNITTTIIKAAVKSKSRPARASFSSKKSYQHEGNRQGRDNQNTLVVIASFDSIGIYSSTSFFVRKEEDTAYSSRTGI